ncbi:MAG: hypothetical protein ACPLY7_00645 [Microgenomates group bacterium]
MQSFLITGSDEKGRLQEVEKFIGEKLSSLENNPDFFVLQAGEGGSIGIAEIKDLQERLSLKPFREKTKTALIKEAQNLTIEAQNALLKTLEEPNNTTLIILTAPDASWLSPTLVSRCQTERLPAKTGIIVNEKEFRNILELFNKLLSSTIAKRLKIIEEEGITKDRETATLWLDKLSLIIRQIMLTAYQIPNQSDFPQQNLSVSQYLNILRLINKYKKYLDANCNVKLSIDNFLLELPKKS